MGKNIKSYATIPTLHYPGKGGKPDGKKFQSISQTKHDSGRTHFSIPRLLKLHVKIPNFFFDLNLQQIMQISCNLLQNSSALASILSDCWPSAENSRKSGRIMQILPIVPMNYAKFAKYTPMASELQESTANHKNSAPSTLPPGEHHKFCVSHTQQTRKVTRFTHLLHIIYMHTYIFCTLAD